MHVTGRSNHSPLRKICHANTQRKPKVSWRHYTVTTMTLELSNIDQAFRKRLNEESTDHHEEVH
jgi:hypothetical protein